MHYTNIHVVCRDNNFPELKVCAIKKYINDRDCMCLRWRI